MDEKVIMIMEKVFETQGLNSDCSQKNCENWDSLHHLNLIVSLEEEFEMEFEPEEIAKMTDFNAVKNMILAKQ